MNTQFNGQVNHDINKSYLNKINKQIYEYLD